MDKIEKKAAVEPQRKSQEQKFLQPYEYIDLYLMTGESLACRLIEVGTYVYFVELQTKQGYRRAMINKHAVKYVIPKVMVEEGGNNGNV